MSSMLNTSQKKYLLLVEIERGFELSGKIYVKAKVPGQKTQKTSVLKDNDNNPVWNERFLFHLNEIPKQIEFEVKEEHTLLPNSVIGNYIVDIHHAQDVTTPVKIIDDIVNLDNAKNGRLKLKLVLQYIDTSDMNNANYNQSTLTKTESLSSSSSDAHKRHHEQQHIDAPVQSSTLTTNTMNTTNVTHMTQSIEQPVEIHRKVIHVERPKIIEVPIIKETHEYIREEPTYIRYDPNIIKEDLGNKDVSQLSQEERNRLQQYVNESVDGKPNILYEKEHIQLEPEMISKPDEIREEQIIYEQPIEIERRHIENIHTKVYEQVTIEKEHVHVKSAPEIKVVEPRTIHEDDKYYSMDQKTDINNTNTTNMTTNNNNNINNDVAMRST